MKNKEEIAASERVKRVSEFVEDRKAIYLQEYRDASTEVEKFIWSEMVSLLSEVSGLLQDE